MHRRTGRVVTLALVAATAVPGVAHAFGLSGGGGRLGYTNPEAFDGTLMVGGHLEFEREGSRLHVMPNVMYWRANRVTDFNPNLDLYYHFAPQWRATPYLGGGLGMRIMSSDITDDTDTALAANVIGGLRFPGGSHFYFLEGRYTASDVSQVSLLGGITFR